MWAVETSFNLSNAKGAEFHAGAVGKSNMNASRIGFLSLGHDHFHVTGLHVGSPVSLSRRRGGLLARQRVCLDIILEGGSRQVLIVSLSS